MSLIIIATIEAKLGMEAQMRQDLLSLLPPTRAEAGCITFDLLTDPKNPTIFVLYEIWESQAALNIHFQMPYVKQVVESYELTLAVPIQAMFLEKID